MSSTRARCLIVCPAAVVIYSGLAMPALAGGPFIPTAPEDETTTSLGQFSIKVAAPFQGMVASLISGGQLPGYTYQQHVLTSPLLYDANTTIGVSMSIKEGSTADTGGVQAGSAANGAMVSDSQMTFPTGWESSDTNLNEVHTVIEKVNLTPLGATNNASVVIGMGNTAPNASNPSVGEVESKSLTPATTDFPVKSFFDVFADIRVTTSGGTSMRFYNKSTDPLLLQADGLTSLPPYVIYTRSPSTSVPLYIYDPGQPDNGAMFGTLMLAGHGAEYTDSKQDQQSFEATYQSMLQQALAPEPSGIGISLIAVATVEEMAGIAVGREPPDPAHGRSSGPRGLKGSVREERPIWKTGSEQTERERIAATRISEQQRLVRSPLSCSFVNPSGKLSPCRRLTDTPDGKSPTTNIPDSRTDKNSTFRDFSCIHDAARFNTRRWASSGCWLRSCSQDGTAIRCFFSHERIDSGRTLGGEGRFRPSTYHKLENPFDPPPP